MNFQNVDWRDAYNALPPSMRTTLRTYRAQTEHLRAHPDTGRQTTVAFDSVPGVMSQVLRLTCRARSYGYTAESVYVMFCQDKHRLGLLVREAYTFEDFLALVWAKTDDYVHPSTRPAEARNRTGAMFVAASNVPDRTVNGVVVPAGGVTEREWFTASGMSRAREFQTVIRDVAVNAGLVEVYPSPGPGRPTVYMPAKAPELFVEALEAVVRDYAARREIEGRKLRLSADERRARRETARKLAEWGPKRETRRERVAREVHEEQERREPGWTARLHAEIAERERELAEYVASGQRERDLDRLLARPVPATAAQLRALAARRTYRQKATTN